MQQETTSTAAPTKKKNSVGEIVKNPPQGWSVHVEDPGPPGEKYRMRLMVFAHPEKGYRVLPFVTKRMRRELETPNGKAVVYDDFDFLPPHPFASALPALAFRNDLTVSNAFEVMVEYAKKQNALPPKPRERVQHKTTKKTSYQPGPHNVVLLSQCVAEAKLRAEEQKMREHQAQLLLAMCCAVF